MNVELAVTVDAPKDTVWALVADIEGAERVISGIEQIEVLKRPGPGILGLEWRETRTMFGKTAVETMRISEVVEGSHYVTEADSHGSHYRTRVYVEDRGGSGTRLGMSFGAEPRTFTARLFTLLLGFLVAGATKKALLRDLEDIKAAAEATATTAGPDES